QNQQTAGMGNQRISRITENAFETRAAPIEVVAGCQPINSLSGGGVEDTVVAGDVGDRALAQAVDGVENRHGGRPLDPEQADLAANPKTALAVAIKSAECL